MSVPPSATNARIPEFTLAYTVDRAVRSVAVHGDELPCPTPAIVTMWSYCCWPGTCACICIGNGVNGPLWALVDVCSQTREISGTEVVGVDVRTTCDVTAVLRAPGCRDSTTASARYIGALTPFSSLVKGWWRCGSGGCLRVMLPSFLQVVVPWPIASATDTGRACDDRQLPVGPRSVLSDGVWRRARAWHD